MARKSWRSGIALVDEAYLRMRAADRRMRAADMADLRSYLAELDALGARCSTEFEALRGIDGTTAETLRNAITTLSVQVTKLQLCIASLTGAMTTMWNEVPETKPEQADRDDEGSTDGRL